MSYRSDFGRLGENLACQYLFSKRYKIIERNFRQKWGELDVVALTPDRILVFVEVKLVQQDNYQQQINAEEQLTAAKLKKLQRIASFYARRRQDLIDEQRGWQIDLIAITITPDKKIKINHYENI